MAKLKVAILISGRGSNMQALIDACAAASFPAEIIVVISNVPGAAGLAPCNHWLPTSHRSVTCAA